MTAQRGDSGPAGWIVLGPAPSSFDSGLVFDWDGEVHQAREDGDDALRDCRKAGYHRYRLYEVTPVDGDQ